MSDSSDLAGDDKVRYFAFGANMDSNVFARRRGIVAESAQPARLRGYALRFSAPGLPLVEPGFANIEPEPGAECWGVLYTMSRPSLDHLIKLEGGSYSLLEVEVEVDVDGVTSGAMSAMAFCDERQRPEKLPSRRYREILVRGAREHGLPAEYLERIARQPAAYAPLLSELFEWGLLHPATFLRNLGLHIEPVIVRIVDALQRLRDRRS